MGWLAAWTGLTEGEAGFVLAAVFVAGIVRGFSGFALSALVMATCTLILPPVELIPMCWALEITATLVMLGDGWRNADRGVSLGLALGGAFGLPIGLAVTTTVAPDVSRLIALALVFALAATQLAKIRFAFLATRPGLYGSGVLAGFATGLASIGGMVVALYTLALNAPPERMRASLVLYFLFGSAITLVATLAYGVMDLQGLARGAIFALPCALGVVVGSQFFTERLQKYYRPFCLCLLMGLAAFGIARLVT